MNSAEITGIERRVQIDRLGIVMDVYQVEFLTAKGIKDRIRVPVMMPNEEIRAAVAEAARELDSMVGPV